MKLMTFVATALAALSVNTATAQETIRMSTVAPGTATYRTMTTFSTIANQNQDKYSIQVDATGASSKHMIELAQGKIDLSLGTPVIYDFLKNQQAMYQKVTNGAELAKNIKLVMWFPYGQYHIVVSENSGIKTLADLRGKKVFLGPPGGAAWQGSYDWLKATVGLDATAGDVENVKASWGSALQAFQDGQIDAYIAGAIAPAPSIEELALTNKIRLLGLTKEEFDSNEAVQEMFRAFPTREADVIPMGVYGDNVVMDGDIYTMSSRVGIVARSDLSEDAVYEVTKAFWENVGEAAESVKWLASLSQDYAVDAKGIPLHPGALRYYLEAGLDVPEGSR